MLMEILSSSLFGFGAAVCAITGDVKTVPVVIMTAGAALFITWLVKTFKANKSDSGL